MRLTSSALSEFEWKTANQKISTKLLFIQLTSIIFSTEIYDLVICQRSIGFETWRTQTIQSILDVKREQNQRESCNQ